MARLSRLPTITEAYPAEYYGSASEKFLPGFEALSHLPPTLLPEAEVIAKRNAVVQGRSPSVLDVGCGRAYLLKRMRQAGWSCAGIDIPQSPVPIGEVGLDCRHGDARSLPWADQSFDLVVINHVLEHLPDPVLACKEAARVLVDGGVLYIGVPNFGSWQSRFFGRNWFPLEIPRHLYHFTPQALAMVVKSAGFLPAHAISTYSLTQGVFGFIQSALNVVDPHCRNVFLSLLKGQMSESLGKVIFNLAGACVLFPAGVVETFVSSLVKQGPVVIMFAQRESRRQSSPSLCP